MVHIALKIQKSLIDRDMFGRWRQEYEKEQRV